MGGSVPQDRVVLHEASFLGMRAMARRAWDASSPADAGYSMPKGSTTTVWASWGAAGGHTTTPSDVTAST